MIEYVIVLLVIIAYALVIYVLNKRGILAKHHFTHCTLDGQGMQPGYPYRKAAVSLG